MIHFSDKRGIEADGASHSCFNSGLEADRRIGGRCICVSDFEV